MSQFVRRSPSLCRLALLGLFGLSSSALAQTGGIEANAPGRGISLPPTSTALSNEATAIQVNPAGLSGVGSLQLFYAHERSLARNSVGDAIYVAQPLGPVTFGLSVEWMRFSLSNPTLPSEASYRRTGWSLAIGDKNLSFGATWNLFGSDANPSLDAISSIDLGFVARPIRYLSIAGVARNVDARTRGSISFDRRYDFGLALRPFGERFSLAADWSLPENWEVRQSTLSYTLQAAVIRGVTVGAGVAHGLTDPNNLRVQVGLTLDTPHFGVGYAGGNGDGGAHHVGLVRFSAEQYPGIATGKKVAFFDLNDLLQPSSNAARSLLGIRGPDPFLATYDMLNGAAMDPVVTGVVLKVGSLPGLGWGKVEELRQAVLRLRQAGKKVVVMLMNADDSEYFLASAADHVFLAPQSALSVNGASARILYLGGAMEKLGVQWDVARVGAYKNAPDQLTRKDMSPEQRETIEAYLDNQTRYVGANITRQREKLTAQAQTTVLAEGLLPPRRAKELGVVDDVLDPMQLEGRLRELMPGAKFDPLYRPFQERSTEWGVPSQIAIIPILGNISGGKSRSDPLGAAEIAGAETVVKALGEASDNPLVAAIVLRIDSPGGEGLASDLMYRAVLEAKKKKPVIASMGDVAASGGYYAAMGADEIYASPTTLTGSIGVFYVKPALGGLAEKLGIKGEKISRGPVSDIDGLYSPWTDAERAAAQRWVDAFYDDFITEVASSRKLDKAKVDQVARGRVWSGTDAKAHGLVDTLGGLHDALQAAQRRANLVGKPIEVGVYGGPGSLFASMGGEPGVMMKALDAVLPETDANAGLNEATKALLREAGLPSVVSLTPGLHAELPFTVQTR